MLCGDLQHVVSVRDKQEDGGVRLSACAHLFFFFFFNHKSGESHHGGLCFGGMYQEGPSPLLPTFEVNVEPVLTFSVRSFFPPVTRCEASCRSFYCVITRFPL